MTDCMAWDKQLKQIERIAGDRRTDRRYDIALELRWKLIRRKKVLDTGTGRTVDLSSGGVLFDAGRVMPVGLTVELSISWPILLHSVAPLQLSISGRIVRANATRAAIRMVQHEFRTAGISPGQREMLSISARTPSPLLAARGRLAVVGKPQ
jgi:c-di-GMP-binding flagellar brake protein YcgR